MQCKFPSPEWTEAFREAVNRNALYRKAGSDWTYGSVAMIIQADPSIGIDEDTGMILDVDRGECHGTQYIRGRGAASTAPFVIVGDYARWKQVILGTLDPIKGMMEGKLKLEKGHLPTMIRFVEASRQLVMSASQVPTEFPA